MSRATLAVPRLGCPCGQQKTVDPIRPTVGICSAALPPWHQLEVGADLPPTAPLVGGVVRRMKALMRRFMGIVRSSMGWAPGGHADRGASLRPSL